MYIEIMRIGLKFKKPISRLSIEDKRYILDGLLELSSDEEYSIRDDYVGDLLSLIQKENENMSKRANNKQKVGNEINDTPKAEPKADTKEKEKDKKKVIGKEIEITKNITLEEMLEYKNNNLTETLYKIFMLDNFKQSIDIEKFKELYQYFIEESSHKGLYFRDGEGKINADGMITLVKKMLNYYQINGKEIKNLKNCLLTFLKNIK